MDKNIKLIAMQPIKPTDVYIPVPAEPNFQRTNEFVINDQKGTTLHYLERRENMIVLTVDEFKDAIKKGYWGGINGYIHDYRPDENGETIVIDLGGPDAYFNEAYPNMKTPLPEIPKK